MAQGYTHVNSRGKTYFLNSKEVELKNDNGKHTLYYFSRDQRAEWCEIPETHEVVENPRNGMLFLRRKVKKGRK